MSSPTGEPDRVPAVRRGRGRPRPARADPARRALLRYPGAGALAQTDLAMSRALLPDRDVDRGPPVRSPSRTVDRTSDRVGHQPAPTRRHHRLGDRPAARGELAHLLERDQETGRGDDQDPAAGRRGDVDRRGRAHLAALEDRQHRQGRHHHGRPHPQHRRTDMRPAVGGGPGPLRHRLRQLAGRAGRRGHRQHRATPPSTRSAATATRSATNSPMPSQSSTPSMW